MIGPFGILLISIIALQVISLFVVFKAGEIAKGNYLLVTVVGDQLQCIEQYERTTYHGMAALSMSDWERLLEQRKEAKNLEKQLRQTLETLLKGGEVFLGQKKVDIYAIKEPEIVQGIRETIKILNDASSLGLKILRSNQWEIKDNPDLKNFQEKIRNLSDRLRQTLTSMESYSNANIHFYRLVQYLTPICAFFLIFALAVFILKKFIMPLDKTISDLHNSREKLTKTFNELQETQMQLLQSEKLASVGQLAAGVAHEINNPVGFISNNMELLRQYIGEYAKILRMVETLKRSIAEEDMAKAKSIVSEIAKFAEEIQLDRTINDTDSLLQHNQRGIERIQKIVMDLKTFAREGSDVMESVKVEEVIDSILSIVQNELKYKAELKRNYSNTPLVKCNAQRLGQVFINLFVNAAQAMEEKGTIEVRTYTQDKFVCVDVSDTGKGIPPENLKKVFDAFFTTKPVGQGTGLGLSVSYEIVKKHGGVIKVQSKVGEGTTFTIMLPIEEMDTFQKGTGE